MQCRDGPKAKGPNPDYNHRHTYGPFEMKDKGAFRDEIEVEVRTINERLFRGSFTRYETKHIIFFEFKNFRGVRLGFKGVQAVTLMLNKVINIDDLESIEEFTFKRCYKNKGSKSRMKLDAR